ncbi:MAG: exo-alpha-sialidase [Lachnospiraceae bacterium]|nr:exo-alpha-sialidase [Lachnospiraceae bacterium]
MNEKYEKMTSENLAVFFIKNAEPTAIIPEIFSLFGFDCMVRCSIDPEKLDALIQEFERKNRSDILILTLIIELIRQGKNTYTKQEKAFVEEIKNFITEHLNEDISINEIAAKLNVSYYYICHFFKEQTGMSLSTFRNQKRIELAMRKLVQTGEKIADVATDCGFNNVSYFTELFTKYTGTAPAAFRTRNKDTCFHDFYHYEDMLLAADLESVCFFEKPPVQLPKEILTTATLQEPDEQFHFLHESAIIEYHGVLYASWYNCPRIELRGYTPIRGMRSYDHGQTWTAVETLADDKSEKILYCPPVYGICDDKLYMFMNEMVAPDHMHSLDLYVLNEDTDKFELLWSRPIPFKLNTNVVTLPNGKLMLPGRVGELDGFPNTPAVMISDSGKIDTEWRLVKIVENGNLPDGKILVHPELSVICNEDILYMFCRNDQRQVPLVYISTDFGETWSDAHAHDIPYISSKIYGGTLSDGRNYLVANTHRRDRSKLVVYFTAKDSIHFESYLVLFDKENTDMNGIIACDYPSAVESDGKLYIITTKRYSRYNRGAVLFTVEL